MIDEQVKQAQVDLQNRIKRDSTRMIWVTFSREGIHAFPAAATQEHLEDVKFLAHPHRHIFHFKVHIEVFHDDRDVEFLQFKHLVEKSFDEGILQLDNKSCEMISDDLYHHIATEYPHRDIWVSVSEDNENGSEIRYKKQFTTH